MLLPSITTSTTNQPPVGIVTLTGAVNGNTRLLFGAPHGCGEAKPGSG
jgi:hypothetical protein